MKNIDNKVVIITGASSGIGAATAKVLAQNSAKVVLSARRENRLKALAEEIGENAAYYVSDVSSLKDMQALAAFAMQKFGRVDALFANAGIMPAGNMSQLKTGDWARMVDINIMGVLNSMAAVLPQFIEQKSGHIIVTSSVAGTRSVPGNAVYCGTKHFVRAMLDSFRQECVAENTNIRTAIIYPGAVQTELLNTVAPSATKTAVEEFYKNIGIQPVAIANAVLFALSQPAEVNVSDIIVRPTREG